MKLVVKNPLSPIEHRGGVGVNCELFELGVDQFVVCPVSYFLNIVWMSTNDIGVECVFATLTVISSR